MIIETGLLPINGGAVCSRYQNNTFPSLSKLYSPGEACALFPHSLDVWNQNKMSPAYGINLEDNYTCSDIDSELFSKACDLSEKYESILFITSSTHSPFKKICDKSSLSLPENMPSYMKDYLKSFNYFDESIGLFSAKHFFKVTISSCISQYPYLFGCKVSGKILASGQLLGKQLGIAADNK